MVISQRRDLSVVKIFQFAYYLPKRKKSVTFGQNEWLWWCNFISNMDDTILVQAPLSILINIIYHMGCGYCRKSRLHDPGIVIGHYGIRFGGSHITSLTVKPNMFTCKTIVQFRYNIMHRYVWLLRHRVKN